MPASREYLEHVVELLQGLGPVAARRMFGGAGLYLDGTMFALVADDVLYFRTDEVNRAAFEAAGMGPFVPFEDGRMVMPYHEAPAELMDDADALAEWARGAWEAARRGARKKARKRR